MIRVDSIDKIQPQFTLIFLHGLGDSSNGWTFIAEKARDFKLLNNFNFIFLDSPTKKLSLQRQKAKAWYDFKNLNDVLLEEDETNILKSYHYLVQQIKEEHDKHKVDYDKIIIGGFSQGCALSLMVLNCFEYKVGGVICLSGYLPLYEHCKANDLGREMNITTPVFLAHGERDRVIDFEMYERTVDILKDEFKFKNVTSHVYRNLGHSCNDQEISDIFQWLVEISTTDE